MTPAARIKASIELLEKIAVSRFPMDGTIGDYMRFRRYIGSKDRAAIAERTYNIMRHHARIGWWLGQMKAEDSPRNHMLCWLVRYEECNQKRIEELFDGSKYGASQLNKQEIALCKMPKGKEEGKEGDDSNLSEAPEAVAVECPPHCEEALRGYFGKGFAKEMAALIPSATLDVRVNLNKISRDEVREKLKGEGIETELTPYSPWGLRVQGKVFLSKSWAFRKGAIEIQDEGSQLIAYLCQATPGMQVLDFCAGAGGKTLAIASAMQNKGRIVAMDIAANRLKKSPLRFKRAGVRDIVEIRPLEEGKNRKWLRRQKGTFDVVLVDVPCSGTGTWRRNPDTRWRQYGPPLEELVETQKEILEKVAKCVKPGGKLVYATCSLLPAENEDRIAAFLKEHDEFQVDPLPEDIPCDGPYMRLTPLRHSTDGFFAAVLERK